MARFITIEGGEGVGKSSFAATLTEKILELGFEVIKTREPGGTPTADLIRKVFLAPPKEEPLVPIAELCLVSAARAQHIKQVIQPALDAQKWVLCDRFSDSTRVYQGHLGNLDLESIESLIKLSTGGIEPDVTFLLDCPVEISLERLEKRNPTRAGEGPNRYDLAAYNTHEALRQAFLKIAADFPNRVCVIDASGSSEYSIDQALSFLKEHLL